MLGKHHFFVVVCIAILSSTAAAAPHPAIKPGVIEHFAMPATPGIAARDVWVWLPSDIDVRKRYAVLYMHDGQMLFDPTHTWNRKAWRVHEVAARLLAEGNVRDFLIVGIANDPARRHAEFFPQAALRLLRPTELREQFVAEALGGRAAADDYLRFLVTQVKPAIDARYPTRRERESTFVMGSSMGGLISLYAVSEYPQVFGAAAALSTHWLGTFERNGEIPTALIAYLRQKLPAPNQVRIYLDRGTMGLDALYDTAQLQADMMLTERGFTPKNFSSRVFVGATHDEDAWHARLAAPLEFLLRPNTVTITNRTQP